MKISSEFINRKRKGEDLEGISDSDSDEMSSLIDNYDSISLGHLAGTVSKFEVERMKRMIFRATRGNALTYFKELGFPIKDYNGKEHNKSMYIVMF